MVHCIEKGSSSSLYPGRGQRKSRTIFRLMAIVLAVVIILAALRFLKVPIFGLGTKPPPDVDKPPTVAPAPSTPVNRLAATLKVGGTQWGVSSCYIGAVE